MEKEVAIIIGAGPAGLTVAYELIKRSNIKPIVIEATENIGGIAKTVNYKGNRIDIGGHRFFSKSDRVMDWWQNIMPLQSAPSRDELELNITYQNKTRQIKLTNSGANPEKTDSVMLIRNRLSRIFFLRKFFNYPITLDLSTILNLGLFRMIRIGISYLKVRILPIKIEKSLEDFFINRFGKELYKTFFKDYTEKVWGVPCTEIEPEWGAQRIKGLSITKALLHAAKKIFSFKRSIAQKEVETSLIENFLYPKLGPGQMWEEVARIVKDGGGEIYMSSKVSSINQEGQKIISIKAINETNGEEKTFYGNYFFSTMPVKDLILSFNGAVPAEVKSTAEGLMYRDFITVGLLLNKLKIKNQTKFKTVNSLIPDNWIYIQESDVKVGRLQIFNNWSPYMVKDKNTAWVGMEYFCNEGDEIWSLSESEMKKLGANELEKIGIIDSRDIIDSVVIKVPKTYPAYFGSYNKFHLIKEYVDKIENLFLIGRNGMHRYNNQDHSMLTAMVAVDNIINGVKDKSNIWDVNVEKEYHEEKSN